MQNDRAIGTHYEDVACEYLEKHHIKILERNFHVRCGEIDIIGRDQGTLVFFEVKYRKSMKNGSPLSAVDGRKQRQISKVALYYLAFHKISTNSPCRFDVLGISGDEITWVKNAFDFQV